LLPKSRTWEADNPDENDRHQRTRDKMKARLEAGELEDRMVELNVDQKAVPVQIFSNLGMEQMDVDFQNMFERIMPKQAQQRQMPIRESRRVLLERESEARIDHQAGTTKGIGRELTALSKEDFLRLLTEPKHALTKQYAELLATEGVTLEFTRDGIEALADVAFEVNRTAQNIGARRLHTILERVVEEVSYDGP